MSRAGMGWNGMATRTPYGHPLRVSKELQPLALERPEVGV
jgi:hypothetical protein